MFVNLTEPDGLMVNTHSIDGLDTGLGDHIYSGGALPRAYFSPRNIDIIDKAIRAKVLENLHIGLPKQMDAALFEEMQEAYFEFIDDTAMMGHTRKVGNFYKDTAGEYFTNTDNYESRGSLSPQQRGFKQVDMRTLMKTKAYKPNFRHNYDILAVINKRAIDRMFDNVVKNMKHKNKYIQEFTLPFKHKHRFSTHPIIPTKTRGPNKNGPNPLRRGPEPHPL